MLTEEQDKDLALLIDHEEELTKWEQEFMESLSSYADNQRNGLSEAQSVKLASVAQKYDT